RLRGWGFFARGAWKAAQVGNRPMERTHQVSRHQTRLIIGAQMLMHWTLPWPPHGICARGRAGAYTIIKKLLLLAFIAVPCEAMGRAGSHWPGPDNIAAVHSRTDDPSRCGQVGPHGPGSWHGFRLPGRNTGASGAKGLYRRDYPATGRSRGQGAERPRL